MSRNQLHGEQLADKILTTLKVHLADFTGEQLDQLEALVKNEIQERDEIGNALALDREFGHDGLSNI